MALYLLLLIVTSKMFLVVNCPHTTPSGEIRNQSFAAPQYIMYVSLACLPACIYIYIYILSPTTWKLLTKKNRLPIISRHNRHRSPHNETINDPTIHPNYRQGFESRSMRLVVNPINATLCIYFGAILVHVVNSTASSVNTMNLRF